MEITNRLFVMAIGLSWKTYGSSRKQTWCIAIHAEVGCSGCF